MIFEEINLPGAFLITLEPIKDERGYFARSFCNTELSNRKLHSHFVQCNISYNHKKGTVRGLHYQAPPHGEVKIVSCRRGAIYDVIVDIRKESPTFGRWLGIELSEKNHQALYIPDGFAHGFQTLFDETEVFYHMGNYYCPEAASGICFSDPTLGIIWPEKPSVISESDLNLPRFIL